MSLSKTNVYTWHILSKTYAKCSSLFKYSITPIAKIIIQKIEIAKRKKKWIKKNQKETEKNAIEFI